MAMELNIQQFLINILTSKTKLFFLLLATYYVYMVFPENVNGKLAVTFSKLALVFDFC